MDLFAVVSLDLMIKHSLSLSYFGNIISHTPSYKSVLKPTIWPSDCTLGVKQLSDLVSNSDDKRECSFKKKGNGNHLSQDYWPLVC